MEVSDIVRVLEFWEAAQWPLTEHDVNASAAALGWNVNAEGMLETSMGSTGLMSTSSIR